VAVWPASGPSVTCTATPGTTLPDGGVSIATPVIANVVGFAGPLTSRLTDPVTFSYVARTSTWPDPATVNTPAADTAAMVGFDDSHFASIVTSRELPSDMSARALIWKLVVVVIALDTVTERTVTLGFGVGVGLVGAVGLPVDAWSVHAASNSALRIAADKRARLIHVTPSSQTAAGGPRRADRSNGNATTHNFGRDNVLRETSHLNASRGTTVTILIRDVRYSLQALQAAGFE